MIATIYMKWIFLLLWTVTNAGGINVYVVFGKGEHCNGFNFCSIQGAKLELPTDQYARAEIALTKDGKIEFSFSKHTVSDRVFLKYFSTGVFILDADYQIAPEICKSLHLPGKTLKAGKYKVITTAEKYVVDF